MASFKEEIRHIFSINDVNTIKARRKTRRGLITKSLHKIFKTIDENDPKLLSVSNLESIRSSIMENIALHEALQNQFDERRELDPDVTEDARAEEILRDGKISEEHEQSIARMQASIHLIRVTQQGSVLMTELEALLELPDFTVPTMVTDASHYRDKVTSFMTESLSLVERDTIITLRKKINQHLAAVYQRQAAEFKSAREASTTPAAPIKATSTKSSRSPLKLHLELPKFSGNPIDWLDFRELFLASLEQHAEDLSEPEKCCLLLNSMKTEDTRRLVQHYKSGTDGFQAALTALADAYGRTTTIYPYHVRNLLTPMQYTYSRESLRAMREKYEVSIRNMTLLKGNNLQKFLGAVLIEQFDSTMLHEWTSHNTHPDVLPDADDLIEFFRQRERQLVDRVVSDRLNKPKKSQPSQQKSRSQPALKVQANIQCPVCSSSHPLSKCATFLKYDVAKRQQVTRTHKHCFNCLAFNHTLNECNSSYTCRRCNGRHHTLLHKDSAPPAELTPPPTAEPAMMCISQPEPADAPPSVPRPSLLHTAIVNISHGVRTQQARAALDPGAALSLMTERLASSLKLPRRPHGYQIGGIGGDGYSKYCVSAKLESLHSNESLKSTFCIVSKIPSTSTPRNARAILQDPSIQGRTPLADPTLGGSLDILIGAIDTVKCVNGVTIHTESTSVAATPTIFGWTVIAPLDHTETKPVLETQATNDPLNQVLSQLWELEQLPDTPITTSEDERALQHFTDTHTVDSTGRYTVRLPRVTDPPPLGESRPAALRRFRQNERSLTRRGKLEQFNDVLQEYFTLDHSEFVPQAELHNTSYYMPVHGIVKDTSTTTKLRAVFDASAVTTTGNSFNDTLLAGPSLHPLLTDILIRFRIHPIAFSADIGKMFREIALDQSEKDLHRFLFRDNTNQIRDCRMKRLTFGVKSSPFLATRVIRHLAETHSTSHPDAAKSILQHFYVDDLLSGAETVQEACHVQQELCHLLKSAGMELRKWRSNSSDFRNSVPPNLLETSDLQLPSPQESSKALGMHWDVAHDTLHVAVPAAPEGIVTKRVTASISAKVYDVMGLFAPAIVPSRMLLQQLWQLKLDWDSPIPDSLAQKWQAWTSDLVSIASRPVPRRFTQHDSGVIFQTLHGFSDASNLAYGAVVYLRAVHCDTSVSTSIVIAKARVAPLKTNTIPRLELVGAHLLSKLLSYASRVLDINAENVFAWTDSSIVLCWLKKQPRDLKTFVANRVNSIQQLVPAERWRHVATKLNPADLLSRGTTATHLSTSSLWWEGPPWLRKSPNDWPTLKFNPPVSLPEVKQPVNIAVHTPPPFDFWEKFSSFSHLTRIVAWIRRFCDNASSHKNTSNRASFLTSAELTQAKLHLLKLSQCEKFSDVFHSISTSRRLPKGHPFSRLDVSVGADGLLRVSGRVRQTDNQERPRELIPLSIRSYLVKLFFSTRHSELSHPGISTSLAIFSETYYVPGLRNHLKHISRHCSVCQKAYARPTAQKMGLLPSSRTSPTPPFYTTGVDFAGPFRIRQGYTRRPVILKVYACVFVCFSTKAVHLEACADLSTEEFLAAFHRFCARRGTPAAVYSDNGSNFQGARNEIQELQDLLLSESTQRAISHLSTHSELQWHFIPPRTPHFGGLWEAGVKAMKTLLRKLVPPHTLTFQELSTILTEAEAVLNSRPMAPVNSTDVDDPLTLTPGHFLIGRPLKAPPQQEASDRKITSLRRWNLVRRLNQDLWVAWSGRYLQSLQERSKWHLQTRQFHVGDVVLLKDETLKQRSWPLARIVKTYPGADGIVRTVDLTCQSRTYKRSTHRLVLIVEDQRAPQHVWVAGRPEGGVSGPRPCHAHREHLKGTIGYFLFYF